MTQALPLVGVLSEAPGTLARRIFHAQQARKELVHPVHRYLLLDSCCHTGNELNLG